MKLNFSGMILPVCLIGTVTGSIFAAVDAPYEVGTWANFCTGAVTHTFDDNMNTNPNAVEQTIFDDKKFHISLCVQSGSCNWKNCRESFAKGHEISNHTVNHQSTVSAMNNCQKEIQKNVPGEQCITIAYPNCNTPGDGEVLKTHYAGRNCDGKTASASPSNMAQISSKMFGTCGGCPNDANGLNGFADQAVSQKGWSVYCHHGIGSQTHSWATTNLNAMKSHLEYLDKNRDKIWCETFGNVTRYLLERKGASVTKKDSTDQGITLSVTDNLPDDIFNYPLSIRRPLPSGWTKAEVTQKGEVVDDTIVTVNSKQYVMFKAVPDGGDVVISSGLTAIGGGRQRFGSNGTTMIRLVNNTLQITAGEFSGNAFSVRIFSLKGEALAVYRLTGGTPSASLPLDNIAASSFIVKITGGGSVSTEKIVARL
jgi:hypothetical protein